MDEFGARLVRALATTPPLEWAGAVLGLAYVILAIRQHVACWLAAFASTAIYAAVFARAGLYLQAGLQVFFLGMAVYGWFAWGGGTARPRLAVTRAGWRVQVAGCIAVAAATAVAALALARTTDAARPWLDSATTWASVFATWLAARKRLESWAWWIAVDCVIAVLCWQQALYPTALLYALYVGLAGIGWLAWARDSRRAAGPA